MLREAILKRIETLPAAGSDQPFREDFDSTVLRHTDTGKWFGLLFHAPAARFPQFPSDAQGVELLNLKCPPDLSQLLQSRYEAIRPAYHMNKRHWISVILSGSLPEEELFRLIRLSYDLTR